MPRDGRLNRLPDPPDRVADELDAPVRVELSGRGHEPQIALADEIHERDPTVLELLGYRNHEPDIVPRKLFLGLDVALEGTPGQGRLLLHGEERDTADLLE